MSARAKRWTLTPATPPHDTLTLAEWRELRDPRGATLQLDTRSLGERRLSRWDDGTYTGVDRSEVAA